MVTADNTNCGQPGIGIANCITMGALVPSDEFVDVYQIPEIFLIISYLFTDDCYVVISGSMNLISVQ
jgi:hypothetical protein